MSKPSLGPSEGPNGGLAEAVRNFGRAVGLDGEKLWTVRLATSCYLLMD